MILDLNYTYQPKVSVFCMVYNHEPFLVQCLEGFLMQKCLFDFEIVVGEDCSNDKSREILLKYQSKFPGKFNLLLHNQNVGAFNNQNIVLSNCTGKYIAMCEGDDYWTDPLKLQKQVDFLEKNEEFVVVYHHFDVLDESTGLLRKRKIPFNISQETKFVVVESFFDSQGWFTQPLTSLFRTSHFNNIKFPNYKFSRDVHLNYHLIKGKKALWINEIMGVYRHHSGGMFSMQDAQKNRDVSYLIYQEIAINNQDDNNALKFFSSFSATLLKEKVYGKSNSSHSIVKILKDNLAVSITQFFKTLTRFFYYTLLNK